MSRVGFPEGTWVACRVEEDKGTAGGCQVLGDRIVGDSQAGEDKVMAAQVGDREMVAQAEDKAMAAQAEDSQATPEDKTIAEEQSADAPDLSITQTHQSYVPSHRQG